MKATLTLLHQALSVIFPIPVFKVGQYNTPMLAAIRADGQVHPIKFRNINHYNGTGISHFFKNSGTRQGIFYIIGRAGFSCSVGSNGMTPLFQRLSGSRRDQNSKFFERVKAIQTKHL